MPPFNCSLIHSHLDRVPLQKAVDCEANPKRGETAAATRLKIEAPQCNGERYEYPISNREDHVCNHRHHMRVFAAAPRTDARYDGRRLFRVQVAKRSENFSRWFDDCVCGRDCRSKTKQAI